MKIGIDKIGFYIPSYYISLADLATARDIDPNKYLIGLGQRNMAIVEKSQDCITLAANAADAILDDEDKQSIDLVFFTTESSIDESKAGGLFLHSLLNLSNKARVVELKQACYSSAFALQMAHNYIEAFPTKKVLILASDIAKYGVGSGGEPTQGAGAVAIVVSKDPKILTLERGSTYISEDIADFFRPSYADVPVVDGKLSTQTYLRFFNAVYNEYLAKMQITQNNFAAICCHMPYAKLGQKALNNITVSQNILNRYEISKFYNQDIGNIYTGSLFLSFISLIENDDSLKPNDRIGFFAYGSGAVGEFFSGTLVEGYRNYLNSEFHKNLIQNRELLTITEYEKLYNDNISPEKTTRTNKYYWAGIENHKRIYKKQSEEKLWILD